MVSPRESEWTRIQTTAAKKTLLLGQIKMATHNLFALMYKHLEKKMPARETDQTLLQLERVCRGGGGGGGQSMARLIRYFKESVYIPRLSKPSVCFQLVDTLDAMVQHDYHILLLEACSCSPLFSDNTVIVFGGMSLDKLLRILPSSFHLQ